MFALGLVFELTVAVLTNVTVAVIMNVSMAVAMTMLRQAYMQVTSFPVDTVEASPMSLAGISKQ